MKEAFKLSCGVEIPAIGYGTWQISSEAAKTAVADAIRCGYRHIDTAGAYKNECGVGAGISQSGIPRSEIFVTSKVWNKNRGYENTLRAAEKTLSDLGLDYLDLYLIHWPANSLQYENPDEVNLSTWRAMIELYRSGRVRAIGVSNFKPSHLMPLLQLEVAPMVNQIEYHLGYTQQRTVDFCQKNGILVEAWSPLGCGRVLDSELLLKIASKYGKTPAQVALRFCLQNGVVPLPKTVTPKRMLENADIFSFSLDTCDMVAMASMEEYGFSGHDPDTVEF